MLGDEVKRCEAMIQVGTVWTRCFRGPADVHHRITRARGGVILDKWGETYHLMNLCREHHAVAHDEGSAFESGLLIDGYVISGLMGPEYTGSDRYLNQRYGPVPMLKVLTPLPGEELGA